tara:strand:+ start:639 stop:3566 length:2928 start_codon:yes stop_codon:yes gene_type:complete
MADSINNKAKEYYDNDNSGGSLNNNLKDFLKQQGAEGNSLNTLWRNYAYGEGGNSLNTRLGKLWGTSGSLIKRWKDVLGLTWDDLKLFFNARRNDPELLLSGATSFDGSDDYISLGFTFSETNHTISGWAKVNDTGSSKNIFDSRDAGTDGITLFVNGSEAPIYRINDSTLTGSTSHANKWVHVVGTYDGTTQKLYINGILNQSATVSKTISVSASANIGKIAYTDSNYMDGSIANVGIWNRALNSSEIESIYWKGQYVDLKGTELTNLVSWYNLSADANDSTGTNNGTNNGATFLTDAYSASSPFLPRIQDKASDTVANYGEVYGGNAVSFDGSNDYIESGASNSIITGTNVTYSFWIKSTDTDAAYVLQNQKGAGSTNLGVRINNTTGIINLLVWDGSSHNALDAVTTINDSQWHHVAFTTTASAQVVYIDGKQDATSSNTFNNSASSDLFQIGRLGSGSSFFGGSLSALKVFSEVLTQDQVRELYTKPELTLPTGIASSALKLDMPMQEGSGVAILDGSGNQNHGTGNGITWATGQEYGFQHSLVRSNNPMVFDGSDDRITNSFDNSAQDATYSFWAKSSKTTANTAFGHGASNKAFHLNFSAGRPILYLAGTYFKYWNDNSAQDDNQWHHYVVVVDVSDANGSKLYIDGSEQTVSAVNNSVPADAYSQGLTIGAQQQSGGVSFDGVINEFAVWHKFLTANEITALYNSGLPLLPTSDSGNYASSSDLVGYWRNDGVITWTDRSTNSNNGTVVGSPASIIVPEGLNEGRDSQGYYLTDTDSISSGIRFKGAEHIEVDNSDAFTFGTGDFSYDFWFKWTDAGHKASVTDAGGVMFTSHSTNSNNYHRLMTYQGTLFYTIKYGGSNVRTADSATGAISSANTWYHIALTVDRSSGGKWYINGSESTLSGETGATETNDLDFTGKLRIGAINYDESSNGSFIGGSIDEFRIYKGKVLSASEVLKNYNNGKSAHSN